MRGKLATVTVLTAVLAACSSPGSPATTPAAVSTTAPITTTMSPTTTTTTAPTTTVDRTAEIEAIFQDLEERRLRALYDGDRKAFRALFANDEYLERSMDAFDVVEFAEAPDVRVEVVELIEDGESCIAVLRVLHRGDLGETSEATVGVIERLGGGWGFSYAGEGWACVGRHPLSP